MASTGASENRRTIRDAVEDDAGPCARIYARHVLDGVATFEEDPPDGAEMLARLRRVVSAGHPWLICEIDGAVAGYAYASAWNERSAYRHTVQDSIYVDGALHRQGVGRALLSALIRRCAEDGRRQMMAGIGGGSAPSVALHQALGFREVGRAEAIGFKFGRWLDVVYMQRRL